MTSPLATVTTTSQWLDYRAESSHFDSNLADRIASPTSIPDSQSPDSFQSLSSLRSHSPSPVDFCNERIQKMSRRMNPARIPVEGENLPSTPLTFQYCVPLILRIKQTQSAECVVIDQNTILRGIQKQNHEIREKGLKPSNEFYAYGKTIKTKVIETAKIIATSDAYSEQDKEMLKIFINSKAAKDRTLYGVPKVPVLEPAPARERTFSSANAVVRYPIPSETQYQYFHRHFTKIGVTQQPKASSSYASGSKDC